MMLASTNYQRVMCQTVSVKVTHFQPFTPPPMSHQSIMSHVNSTGHSNITVDWCHSVAFQPSGKRLAGLLL